MHNVNCINRIISMKRKSGNILETCLLCSVCHVHACPHRTKQLTHTHAHPRVHKCACTDTHTLTHTHTSTHTFAHVCRHTHTLIQRHALTHSHTNTHAYIHIHTQSDTAQTKSRRHRPELPGHLGLFHPPHHPYDHTPPRLHYCGYRGYRVSSPYAPYSPLCGSPSYGVAGTSGVCSFLRLYHDTTKYSNTLLYITFMSC